PNGSSGLNSPILSERPAARRMAATAFTLKVNHKDTKPQRRCLNDLCAFVSLWLIDPQSFKRTDCVLPRHLLAPLIDEIGVIQRTGFDVSGFRRGLNLIVVEGIANQNVCGVDYFNG